MPRDTRTRWRGIAFLALLALLIGLAAWLRVRHWPRTDGSPGPAVLHDTGPLGADDSLNLNASLIVTEHGAEGGRVTRCRVVRYDFESGRVQPPETVWEGSWSQFSDPTRIVGDRYLVSWTGSVIDLKEKTLLHEGAGRLIEVPGDRIVSGFFDDSGRLQRLVAFNWRTRASEKLTARAVEEFTLHGEQAHTLPGEQSPDGTKSVYGSDDQSLTLFRIGHPPKKLGRFDTGRHAISPGLWLGNERILTQDGNGQLIEVDLDGGRVPVVQIPVKEKKNDYPYFRRDADGRIIYACGREQFLINAEAKTWEPCEWVSLGHGFEESCGGDGQMRHVYRYKGTEIARSPFWTLMGPIEVTTESYIAVWIDGRVRVWWAGTGKWTTLSDRTNHIAGWIK